MWAWMRHGETEAVHRFPTSTTEYWAARGWLPCDDPDAEPELDPAPAEPVDPPAPSGPVRSARKAKDNG